MTYSESESDFSFALNLVSDFNSASKSDSDSDSESDSSLAFRIQTLVFSLFYICIPLSKDADGFFYPFRDRINSYASSASIMHIFLAYHYSKRFYHSVKFSYFNFQVFLIVNRFAMKFNAQFSFKHIPNIFVFFPHFIIFNQKRHVFATVFKVFDVSIQLR